MLNKNNVLVIGLGNCGSKIASGFQDKGYEVIYANGSSQDLKVLGGRTGVYKLEGYDGFGGNRNKAMDCLLENDNFTDALQGIKQDIIILIYAAGGSTGSGLSYIIAEHLTELYDGHKVIINVPVLPSDSEDINKHRNAYQCLKDLSELEGLGATIVLDNNKALDGDVKWINESFIELMDSFITYDSWGVENNFDSAEKMNMIMDEGYMIIDAPRPCYGKLMECSPMSTIQNDMICSNIAVLHSDNDTLRHDNIIAEVGKPLNVYNGYGSDKSMVIVSGMTLPFDTIKHIGQLAKDGQAERKRNMAAARIVDLDDLGFEEDVKPEKKKKEPEKMSRRASLMAMKKKYA